MSDIKRFELLPSDGECFLEEDVCCDGSLVYYEDHREVIKNLEKQLAEVREATRKAFDWALDITDEDFNSRDEVGNNNKVKQVLWEEYKEKNNE